MSEDCAYCAISMSFSKKTRNNMFITEGIRDWKNAVGEKQGILSNHCCSPGHLKATELSEKGQQKSINSVLSKAYEEKVNQNCNALLSILDIIIQLSKRNIALRGSRTGENEDGNFSHFLTWKSSFDATLTHHLETAPQNAKYIAQIIQNELTCCEAEIQEDIVKEIKKPGFLQSLQMSRWT